MLGYMIGYMFFLVVFGGQQFFIQSDVIGIYQFFVINFGWFLGFDSDGFKVEVMWCVFFDCVIVEKGMIVGYYFGFLNVGMFVKDGNGYVFIVVKV